MFNTPLAQVTYEQVLDFCRAFPEGVRVEYKREVVNTPKVVSSFANTVGGIWIIGVDADKKTNRALLPPVGLEERPGIEEQIVQSSQAGIYPAITPTVRVVPMTDQKGRVVVVVKVPESIEAPHAIENSTRVWMRTASTTEPYDYADIERIAYLLERRRQPEQRRERLIEQAAARSLYHHNVPHVRVVISPVYPRGILLSHDELHERAQALEMHVRYLRDFRSIHEAISSVGKEGRSNYYFELSVYGVAFFEAPDGGVLDVGDTPCVFLGNLLYPLGNVLNTALMFLKDTGTNVLIRYELIGWNGIGFMPHDPREMAMPAEVAKTHICADPRVEVSTVSLAETLTQNRAHILAELMRQVLWAFNFRMSQVALHGRVTQVAKELKLI